jgi:hypothetical protein
LDISGGGLFTTFFIFVLAFFYLIFSFALFNGIRFKDVFRKGGYQNSSWRKIVFAIITGYVLFTLLIGIMFRIQYWAGAGMILKLGILQSIPVLVFALIRYMSVASAFCSKIMMRLIILLFIGLFFMLMPRSFMIGIKYRDDPGELQRHVVQPD